MIVLEIVSLVADYLIKKASLQNGLSGWKPLAAGAVVYGATAIGWFLMMRSYKLVTVSVMHSFGVMALSLLMGLFIFRETITPREWTGVALGLVALYLLMPTDS